MAASLLALVSVYVGGKVPKSGKLLQRVGDAIKRVVQIGARQLHGDAWLGSVLGTENK